MKTKLMCSIIMCMLAGPCLVYATSGKVGAEAKQIIEDAAKKLANAIKDALENRAPDRLGTGVTNYPNPARNALSIKEGPSYSSIGSGTALYLKTSYFEAINNLCTLLEFSPIDYSSPFFSATGPFWNMASSIKIDGHSDNDGSWQIYTLSNVAQIKLDIKNALNPERINTIKQNPQKYGFLSDALNNSSK